MSISIYQEALNDAKLIKESAEDKVKEKLIEKLSPQIKKLIEASFNEKEDADEDMENESDNSSYSRKKDEGCSDMYESEDVDEGCHEVDESEDVDEDCSDMYESEDVDEDCSDMYESSRKNITPFKKIEKNVLFETDKETNSFIKKLINKNPIKENFYKNFNKFNTFLKKNSELSNIDNVTLNEINDSLDNFYKEIKLFENNSIIIKDKILLKDFLIFKKEIDNMSRRVFKEANSRNKKLFEMYLQEKEEDSEKEEDELDLSFLDDDKSDMGKDEDEDQEVDFDSDEESEDEDYGMTDSSSLGDIADDLSDISSKIRDMIQDEQEEEEEDEEEDEEEEEDEDEEEGEEMEEGYGMKENARRRNRMLQIDENMLKREISKMRKLKEGEAKSMAHHFGGGKLGKEMFVDVDDRLLNAYADELGDAPRPKVEAAMRNERRKNRMLENRLQEYKSALKGMKEQLSEMNLFNAKLLYANKLMQNKDLSLSQQKQIVESLDSAKTLNEAKLLFESLSKSLIKTTRSGNQMNENRRVLSSSSRTVTSSQSAGTQSADLSRWALLAGIKK